MGRDVMQRLREVVGARKNLAPTYDEGPNGYLTFPGSSLGLG